MIELNDEQRKALDAMMSGRNVFLTGEAGTGKSTVLREFLDRCDRPCAVLAPTGVAAINVGSLAKGGNRQKPFGGKQMVFVGDFFQLPPVVKTETETEFLRREFGGEYAFERSVPMAIEPPSPATTPPATPSVPASPAPSRKPDRDGKGRGRHEAGERRRLQQVQRTDIHRHRRGLRKPGMDHAGPAPSREPQHPEIPRPMGRMRYRRRPGRRTPASSRRPSSPELRPASSGCRAAKHRSCRGQCPRVAGCDTPPRADLQIGEPMEFPNS